MSHFTVGVILENPHGDNEKLKRDLEKALEPFQEYDGQEWVKPYCDFISTTEQNKHDYETGAVSKVRCPDGTLVSPYDEMFRLEGTIGIMIGAKSSHKVPENAGFEEVDVPFKELYHTFGEYMDSGYSDGSWNEEKQDYGYFKNPKGYWDWYIVGGRYRDNLLVKGNEYVKGERSFLDLSPDKQAPDGYNWASGGIIKDIDFKRTIIGKYEEAIRFWELIVEEQPLKDGEKMPFSWYKKEYYTDRYGTKENFAEHESTFSTHALLIDGEWYEKGEMLWFGVDAAAKEGIDGYLEKFKEIMSAEENQDKMFIVVDCHI